VARGRRGGAAARWALLALCGAASAASGQDDFAAGSWPRGPIESREEWLLVQGRMALPPVAPDPLAAGETRVRVDLDWGSDFGWDQQISGEAPGDRRFLVDGEHRTLALEARHGLGERFAVGVRLPLHWRGPGLLDDVIDAFHGFTRKLGLPDNGRPRFLTNQFRALGRDDEFRPVRWDGQPGTGLGNVELSGHWAFAAPAPGTGWAAALIVRASLPTGREPFSVPGLDGGLQLVAARRLAAPLELHLGLGGTAFGDVEVDAIRYTRGRIHAFTALEWRPGRRWSLMLQADASSRLVTNLARYPGLQSYLKIGARFAAARRWAIEAGFTENMVAQQATTDFGIFLGITRRLR
jgi:hypothetical protein